MGNNEYDMLNNGSVALIYAYPLVCRKGFANKRISIKFYSLLIILIPTRMAFQFLPVLMVSGLHLNQCINKYIELS